VRSQVQLGNEGSLESCEGVVFFAFAEEDEFVEEEMFRAEDELGVVNADVVHVDAAGLDVFSCLALRWTQAGRDQNFDQRAAGLAELSLVEKVTDRSAAW